LPRCRLAAATASAANTPDSTARPKALTLYCATGSRRYLIASSQGNNSCKVYDRGEGNRALFTIETQTGGQLPHGVFVAHDGGKGRRDRGGDSHFYPWEAIAGDRWIVDTQWSPRGRLER
jgi:myo-inositol-hexaphosphate 3-phosphohydrolase